MNKVHRGRLTFKPPIQDFEKVNPYIDTLVDVLPSPRANGAPLHTQ